jgi:hypothetical protein
VIFEDEDELTTILLPNRRSIQMLSHLSYRCISTAQAQESGSLKGVAVFEGEGMLFQLEDPQVAQSGHGRCILTDKDDNKVFAKWTCYGTPINCKGAFTFTGGTGKFKGISGINEFYVKTDVLAFQKTGEPGMVKKAGAGEAVWPEITYQLPSK